MFPSGPRTVGRSRGVRFAMGLGAAFDLVFAIAILAFRVPAASLLGLALPEDPLYLGLTGVLLSILGAVYLLAWREPERYRGIVPVSSAGRLVGALYLGRAWLSHGPPVLAALALSDLGLAVLAFVTWVMSRESNRG